MEDSRELRRLARLDAERDDVLDLEVDRIADTDAVGEPFLHDLDRGSLDAEHLSDERRQGSHRASQLAAEDGRELLHLLVRGAFVDEHAETPVPLGHDLGGVCDHGERTSVHLRPLDLALADVEDQRHAAVVVRRPVVEREVARAHELAGARFEVGPLDAPRHAVPPCAEWRKDDSWRREHVCQPPAPLSVPPPPVGSTDEIRV